MASPFGLWLSSVHRQQEVEGQEEREVSPCQAGSVCVSPRALAPAGGAPVPQPCQAVSLKAPVGLWVLATPASCRHSGGRGSMPALGVLCPLWVHRNSPLPLVSLNYPQLFHVSVPSACYRDAGRATIPHSSSYLQGLVPGRYSLNDDLINNNTV